MVKEVLLGFDYGKKRIGVAIGNTFSLSSYPLEIIYNAKGKCFDRIGFIISQWEIKRVIVGMSLDLNGLEQDITLCIYKFANQLKKRFNVTVEFVDESYSSIEAQSLTSKRDYDDDVAACIILQRYLDSLK